MTGLTGMPNASIYEGKRLAQPDEVANYQTGDGLEKAFLLANIIRFQNPEQDMRITADSTDVILSAQKDYRFISDKNLTRQILIPAKGT